MELKRTAGAREAAHEHMPMIKIRFKQIVTWFFIGLPLAGLQAQGRRDLVPVRQVDDGYSLQVGQVELRVNPEIGGRITSLSLAGQDFLTDSLVNSFNWGSSFWPSPQSDWHWPPPAEIDNAPYQARVVHGALIMVSQPDPRTGLVATKTITGHRRNGSFVIEYRLTNTSDSVRQVAPWEVTRVHTGGVAFFPMGEGALRGGLIPLMTEKDGIQWFRYEVDKLPKKGDRQIYTDGAEGWFAEVNDGVMLVKQFPDYPKSAAAPKEGEVELYASPVSPGHSYVEVEHQGAYKTLAPGESLDWKMTWFLRRLPAGMTAEVGNAALVDYVRKLVGRR